MAGYKIELKGNALQLALSEMGQFLEHNDQFAETEDHPSEKDLIVQWVLIGSVGDSLALSYKNSRGEVSIVKASKITRPSGIHENGAVFQVP